MCSVAFSDQNARSGPLRTVGGAGHLGWCQPRLSLGVRAPGGGREQSQVCPSYMRLSESSEAKLADGGM